MAYLNIKRVLALMIGICFLLSSCGYSGQEIDNAVNAGYENGYKSGYQSGYEDGYEAGAVDALSSSGIGVNEETVYITENGSKYHREWCGALWHSSIPISLAKAIERGYEPCARCW